MEILANVIFFFLSYLKGYLFSNRENYFMNKYLVRYCEEGQKELEKMEKFTRSRTCRRKSILAHFDENWYKDNCESCDICLKKELNGLIKN